MTLLAEAVAASDAIASNSSRTMKVSILADLLKSLEPEEILPTVGFLSGVPRQGKIGVGWASISSVQSTSAEEPSLSISDLDELLSRVQSTIGTGSVGERNSMLLQFFNRATEREADFVRRLLVGELRQGALGGIMADAIARASGVDAPLVRRAAMLSGDLGETARLALISGAPALSEIGLQVLRPVLPMLASTSDDVSSALEEAGRSSVEWKLDGIRIQVHRDEDEVRIFTRNLNEITGRLPEIVELVRALPARKLVLDGETLAVDEKGAPHAFQDIMSRVGRHSEQEGFAMAPWFFDLMHLDGADLIDRPLYERMEALEAVAPDWRVPAMVTEDAGAAQKFLGEALAAGHEGVVVKAIDSVYQAGRRGKAWRKVKVAKSLDLVVLGVEWGHGRRQGWLSNLHLGARDPEGGFVMVGKTFKGLTDEVLKWQTERFLELETKREGITVFVRPEVVVEIELDGVQVSPRYPGGVALRFARVVRYREDKDPSEADTIDTVRSMLSGGDS